MKALFDKANIGYEEAVQMYGKSIDPPDTWRPRYAQSCYGKRLDMLDTEYCAASFYFDLYGNLRRFEASE